VNQDAGGQTSDDDDVDPACRELDPLIAVLGTPALSPADAVRLRAHLDACERCSDLARMLVSASGTSDARTTVDHDGAGAAPLLSEGAMVAGRYRLDRILGRGGMGVVWAATQIVTRQPVAIKLLGATGGLRARKRLLREARAACAVRHPNVVRIFDVAELDDGAPALVMELLRGRTLQRVFDLGPVRASELCAVLGKVAAALEAVHRAGIVHRDLKPENIFLTRGADGGIDVKLLDFGIARRTTIDHGLASGTLTSTGALVGTPFYMSPEQALGEKHVDVRADLWALGLLLYQGLSGSLPTRADNLGQVIKAIAMTPIDPIERLVPGIPDDLAALVAQLLAKSRDERPALAEVRAVLARHEAKTLEELARSVDGDPSPVVGPARRSAAQTPRAAPSRPARARRASLVVGAALAVGLGLSLLAFRALRAPAIANDISAAAPPPVAAIAPATPTAVFDQAPRSTEQSADAGGVEAPAPRGNAKTAHATQKNARPAASAATADPRAPLPSSAAPQSIGIEREF
jgi:serine/threonine-protein kinase